MDPLPIDPVLPGLVEAVRSGGAVVLRAPTGAGKTTRVAPALLGVVPGRIIMLEPRRIAARAAARRMAEERGEPVGGTAGYSVRFDRKVGPRTRIEVVTEGLFLRRLQEDPFLEGVGAVIFDEFHERNLDSDLALAMAQRVRQDARPDLAVVVMSATLDPAPLTAYLGCPSIESDGRSFPVEVEHEGAWDEQRIEDRVRRGVRRVLEATEGDVLVFLPGVGEIRRSAESVADIARRADADLLELYGDLPPDRQDAVLRPSPRRKIVLATNVAETSVTIPGVTAVVDTGRVRRLIVDPSLGMPRLELGWISRASAQQRTGRAGRTAPGRCLRLWSASRQRMLDERDEAEIRRADLAGVVLQLRAWGEPDLTAFPWFEAPAPEALERAETLLVALGAFDPDGTLTGTGRDLARLPAHPRAGRLLLAGREFGVPRRAALAAALLTERAPFHRERGRRAAEHTSDSDVLDRVEALEQWEQRGPAETVVGRVRPGSARFVLQARSQFLRLLGKDTGRRPKGGDSDSALRRALLAALPDRVARRREAGSNRAVMVGGRGVRLGDESAVHDAELFVCVEIDAGRRGERAEGLVRVASAVEREWLDPRRITQDDELAFDPGTERVIARRITRFADLVVRETVEAAPRGADASVVLERAAAQGLGDALDLDRAEVRSLRERVSFLTEWMPELAFPTIDDATLRDLLPALCAGRRSFAELRKQPLADFISGVLSPQQQRALAQHAPTHIAVPSGSRIRLAYDGTRAPVLAARIQEMFGLAETPRVAAGRVPVLLHLLAPNRRPQQVTDDLKSFWNDAYHVVRKELRRRYPKHAWPEDPWSAQPERRPRRRK